VAELSTCRELSRVVLHEATQIAVEVLRLWDVLDRAIGAHGTLDIVAQFLLDLLQRVLHELVINQLLFVPPYFKVVKSHLEHVLLIDLGLLAGSDDVPDRHILQGLEDLRTFVIEHVLEVVFSRRLLELLKIASLDQIGQAEALGEPEGAVHVVEVDELEHVLVLDVPEELFNFAQAALALLGCGLCTGDAEQPLDEGVE